MIKIFELIDYINNNIVKIYHIKNQMLCNKSYIEYKKIYDPDVWYSHGLNQYFLKYNQKIDEYIINIDDEDDYFPKKESTIIDEDYFKLIKKMIYTKYYLIADVISIFDFVKYHVEIYQKTGEYSVNFLYIDDMKILLQNYIQNHNYSGAEFEDLFLKFIEFYDEIIGFFNVILVDDDIKLIYEAYDMFKDVYYEKLRKMKCSEFCKKSFEELIKIINEKVII